MIALGMVVLREFAKRSSQGFLSEEDQIAQTLGFYAAHVALAESVWRCNQLHLMATLSRKLSV